MNTFKNPDVIESFVVSAGVPLLRQTPPEAREKRQDRQAQ
jgi:hypothetical protein